MNKPTFTCGPYSVNPEHPSDWSIPAVTAIAKSTSLGGSALKDLSWRKYSYVLTWDAMSKADFEALEQLVNYHNDQGVNVQFSYDKFPNTVAPVEVHIDPLDRKRTLGAGNVNYYQNVQITMVEAEAQ